MNNNALTTKNKWENVWIGVQLPVVKKPVYDVQKQLETYLPRTAGCSLIEIGCAPGGWMAYFHNHFGYRVSGIEYAELAAEATKKNMELLRVKAEVSVQDFFLFDCVQDNYDIVFSAGFIEHFRDVSLVMERICSLSRGYVVTIVPNLFGVNGFVSRTIRPRVYAEHNPIDAPTLDLLHTNCGMRTLFCDFVGGVRFIMPGAGNDFFKTHRYFARAVNAPVRVVNQIAQVLSRFAGYTPRSIWLSDILLYIGKK